jgi:hypothetical protein
VSVCVSYTSTRAVTAPAPSNPPSTYTLPSSVTTAVSWRGSSSARRVSQRGPGLGGGDGASGLDASLVVGVDGVGVIPPSPSGGASAFVPHEMTAIATMQPLARANEGRRARMGGG